MSFKVEDVSIVTAAGVPIVRGTTLTVAPGSVHVLMGPNGSGKSTLAFGLMGHMGYRMTSGRILVDEKDITNASPDERARAGLFLSFQYPMEITGVSVQHFLRSAYTALHPEETMDIVQFAQSMKEHMKRIGIPESFMQRSLNEGFSGGEKKRMEMLQLAVLRPRYAILDETDSGLDVDAIKQVSAEVERAKKNGIGILLITHYARVLRLIPVDRVHVFVRGEIVHSGGADLAEQVERDGYTTYVSASKKT